MKTKSDKMSALFPLLLFAVTAICVLSVLAAGVGAYSKLRARDEITYNSRTAAGYIATKVRQTEGEVSVGDFGGLSALTFRGDGVITRIYCFEGYLYELYHIENSGSQPLDGEKIVPLRELSWSISEGVLSARLHDGEKEQVLHFFLREEGVK